MKSFVFGILVAGIGCLRGLQTKTGAAAVGESTTSAVVSGIILIAITDGIFSVVYYFLGSRWRRHPSSETIIHVENFKAAYDGQVVLDHINFEVYAGEVFAILGRFRLGQEHVAQTYDRSL